MGRGWDVVFLIDGSGSVGTKNFATVKRWVREVSARFIRHKKQQRIRLAVVQYSHFDSRRSVDFAFLPN